MHCLDSDFLIALLKDYPDAEKALRQFEAKKITFCTTIVNVQEVLFGLVGTKVYEKASNFILQLNILDYTWEEMEVMVQLSHRLKKTGKRIGFADEMIAGICLAHDATIITRNTKHFKKVKGLKVIRW